MKRIKKDKNNKNELSKLCSPEELWKHRWSIYATQFLGRGSAVAGAVLTFQDQGTIGGGILGIYPLAELVASKLEERLKVKEKEWEEFVNGTENFLDNYHELLGILEQIKKSEVGAINTTLNDLREKTKEFLDKYDKEIGGNEKNGVIDIIELTDQEARKNFAEELSKEQNQLDSIIKAIKELEDEVVKYRQETMTRVEGENNHQQPQEAERRREEENQLNESNIEIRVENLQIAN